MLDHRSPLITGHIGNRSTARVRRYATKVGDSCDETGDYEVIASRRPINAVNDARLWHPWLRINRVLRVMLQTRWSGEAWSEVRIEFRRALALRSEIRRAGWFN